MNKMKYALAILLQLSTAILTTIIHYNFLVYAVIDGYNFSVFSLLIITIIVEAFAYLPNIATFRGCKKRSIKSSNVIMIIANVLNVPITLLLICIYIF
jgi:hypothetical protein